VAVLVVQGYLEFASAEQALLALRTRARDTELPGALVIDLDHVTRCHPVAAALLDAMIGEIEAGGVTVVTVDRRGRRLLASSGEFTARADALALCGGGATPA
jgi:anti-anti-sigma regulatory factor